MDHQVKLAWRAELESGLWALGRHGFLHCVTDNTWSSLGVLCEIGVRKGLPIVVTEQTAMDVTFRLYDGQSLKLPESVRKWAVLRGPNPRVGRGKLTDLTVHGVDFKDQSYMIAEGL